MSTYWIRDYGIAFVLALLLHVAALIFQFALVGRFEVSVGRSHTPAKSRAGHSNNIGYSRERT